MTSVLTLAQTNTEYALRTSGSLEPMVGLAVAGSCLCIVFLLYLRETKHLTGPVRFGLPLLRSLTIALAILMLLRPYVELSTISGTLGEVVFLVDSSPSMQITDPGGSKTRVEGVLGWLGSPEDPESASGFAASLSDTHRVRVVQVGEGMRATDIASMLRANQRSDGSVPSTSSNAAARTVLLVSDGQNWSGDSPVTLAKELVSRGSVLGTIGVGANEEPDDVAILEIRQPRSVDPKNVVRGFLRYKRIATNPEPVPVSIRRADGEIVWESLIAADAPSTGTIDFTFAARLLQSDSKAVGEELSGSRRVQASMTTVQLSASIGSGDATRSLTDLGDDAERDFAIALDNRQYSMLLVDGRSRWETRYLRNLFERDPRWTVRTVLAGPGTSQPDKLPLGSGHDQFPDDEEQLHSHDFIVFGELPNRLLSDEHQRWLVNFVDRGGALAFVDGNRNALQRYADSPLGELLPTDDIASARGVLCDRIAPTPAGEQTEWLQLGPSSNMSAFTGVPSFSWESLKAPHSLRLTRAKPDAQVLLEAYAGSSKYPLLVRRQFGGGTVLYFASDETWRWRFGVADLIHAKFWNQLVLGVMFPPLALQNDLGAVDMDAAEYVAGDQALIRVKLFDTEGQPANEEQVQAELRSAGQVVARVPLEAHGRISGMYQAMTQPLSVGNYELHVVATNYGLALESLSPRFNVVAQPTSEMTNLARNSGLLKQIAAAGEGAYFDFGSEAEIRDWLEPRTSGYREIQELSLWDKYFWFLPMIVLLALEWWIRKRVGLP